MDIYKGSGKEPQIEISDNAFKIVLPNLNAQTKKQPSGKTNADGKETRYGHTEEG